MLNLRHSRTFWEYGCDLHPVGTGLCLSGGHHELVLSQGAVVADQQHDGC